MLCNFLYFLCASVDFYMKTRGFYFRSQLLHLVNSQLFEKLLPYAERELHMREKPCIYAVNSTGIFCFIKTR